MLRLPLALAQPHCVRVPAPPISPGPCSGPTVLPFLSLFLCLRFLSPSLLGTITEVLEFGALPVLGSLRLSAGLGSAHCLLECHPDGRSAAVFRASLWSSCVVLPLLALTWMSAVLAMTDRRSILFQALFAVFNSAQGFVITAVHCFLRREVGLGLSCPCTHTSPGQSSHFSSLCREEG